MLYWKAAIKTQVKGFNIMVMILQPQGKGFPMFVFAAVLTACVHWDVSLLPMWEALPVPSGWRFTSYPPAGGECCRAPQNKDLLVLHFQWSSSLSPTWNSTSQAISKRKFQACYMPSCSWLKSRSKAPNRPCACLIFQAHLPQQSPVPPPGSLCFRHIGTCPFPLSVFGMASEPISTALHFIWGSSTQPSKTAPHPPRTLHTTWLL